MLHVFITFLPALTLLCCSACVPQPEGEGKYEWSDGSCYEGGWKVHRNARVFVVSTAQHSTASSIPTAS